MSQKRLEKRFGQSPIFIASTFMTQGGIPPSTNPASLLKEAIHVISCGYEDKTEWGKEVSGATYNFLFLPRDLCSTSCQVMGVDSLFCIEIEA
jgi:hypothetical protein